MIRRLARGRSATLLRRGGTGAPWWAGTWASSTGRAISLPPGALLRPRTQFFWVRRATCRRDTAAGKIRQVSVGVHDRRQFSTGGYRRELARPSNDTDAIASTLR